MTPSNNKKQRKINHTVPMQYHQQETSVSPTGTGVTQKHAGPRITSMDHNPVYRVLLDNATHSQNSPNRHSLLLIKAVLCPKGDAKFNGNSVPKQQNRNEATLTVIAKPPPGHAAYHQYRSPGGTLGSSATSQYVMQVTVILRVSLLAPCIV